MKYAVETGERERERQRYRKYSKEDITRKIIGKVRDTLLSGRRECIILSEGSQVSPVRPSDKRSIEVKTLRWLEAVA
jgi:hypothetical protein